MKSFLHKKAFTPKYTKRAAFKSRMKQIIIKAILVYLGLLAFLYFYQRSLLYFPDKQTPHPADFGVEEQVEVVHVTTRSGLKLHGWYIPPGDPAKPDMVFFHGNAGHFGHRIYKAAPYIEAGYGVLLAEYPGYGGNPGKPSEEGFYESGRAFISWLQNEKERTVPVLYGESIGTGVAVQMAGEFDIDALILEAPYSSMVHLGQSRYIVVPVGLLLKDRYESINKIEHISVPKFFIHGVRDMTIPIKFARQLYDKASEPKSFVEIEKAGHNDLYNYGAQLHVLDFLSTIGSEKTDQK